MDYLKYNLTPLDEVKGEEPKTESEKAARAELNRHRQETQRYKQKYFEYYDERQNQPPRRLVIIYRTQKRTPSGAFFNKIYILKHPLQHYPPSHNCILRLLY